MEQNIHTPEEWTSILEKQVFTGGDVRLEDIQNAFAHITEESDKGQFGRCHYYMAFYCLRSGMLDECLEHVNESIRCMVGTPQEKKVSACYNMLGVIAHGQNNLLMAAEQYNKALDFADRYGDSYTRYLVGGNLADIYYRIGAYDKAFWWNRESIKDFQKSGDNSANGIKNYMEILASYGFCLAMTGRLKEAEEVYDKLSQMQKEKEGEQFPFLCVYTFFSLLYYKEQREELANACLNVAVQSVLAEKNITQYVDQIQNLLELLILMEKYGYLGTLLDYLQPLAEAEGNEGFLLQLLAYQLKYCRDKMSEEQYLERTEHFFRIKVGYEERENSMIFRMMEMRKRLLEIEETQHELEKENVRLQFQADHDELSGLYNKGKLSRYAEDAFDMALKNGFTMSVLFVDIDFFKQMNDCYGHAKGDECVRAVADSISRCMPGDFAARYGGDEFVVIAINRTEEYMRECGEKIIRDVRARQIPNIGSDVEDILTVTVGIAHAVPIKLNKVWDFLSAADDALYRQKQDKRGGMCFCGEVGAKVK